MTTQTIKYRIRTLYATAATFAAENPVLLEGEPATESDTGREKIGDGVTAWNSLAYKGIERNHDWTTPYDYLGTAPLGTADSAAKWRITRLTIDAAGAVTATGTATNVTWTGRIGHTYT